MIGILLTILLLEKFVYTLQGVYTVAYPMLLVWLLFIVEMSGLIFWFIVTDADILECDETSPCTKFPPFLACISVCLTVLILLNGMITVSNVDSTPNSPL